MSYYLFAGNTNATSDEPFLDLNNQTQKIIGFITLGLSTVFFGSNFLPVKQFETGDGVFFQLFVTLGIWTVGFVINAIRNFPTFYPLPLLGGFFWVIKAFHSLVINYFCLL